MRVVLFDDVRKALPRRILTTQPRHEILMRDLKYGSFSVVMHPILCDVSAEKRKCANHAAFLIPMISGDACYGYGDEF